MFCKQNILFVGGKLEKKVKKIQPLAALRKAQLAFFWGLPAEKCWGVKCWSVAPTPLTRLLPSWGGQVAGSLSFPVFESCAMGRPTLTHCS